MKTCITGEQLQEVVIEYFVVLKIFTVEIVIQVHFSSFDESSQFSSCFRFPPTGTPHRRTEAVRRLPIQSPVGVISGGK